MTKSQEKKFLDFIIGLLNDDYGIKLTTYAELEELVSILCPENKDIELILNATSGCEGRVYLGDEFENCTTFQEIKSVIEGEE